MYRINLGTWNAVFAVPCSIVDQHLRLAGSVQLKVLLWALRHAGEPFDEQAVSHALGIRREDVSDAMLYWRETGVFAQSGDELAPPCESEPAGEAPAKAEPAPLPSPVSPAAEENPAASPAPIPAKILTRPQKPDNAFVARRVTESEEIACLMQEAERILGRLLSTGASATLLMLHDDFGLPTDVLIMLLQYAASAGKTSIRYIEKVGMDWAEEEIFTHERAEEKLRRIAENARAWHVVEQAIGLAQRSPTAKEEAFASRWIGEWQFSADMIREAYERCVNAKGQLSMSYMNGILTRWHAHGIVTLEDANKEQEQKTAARKKEKERRLTYDIDAYEQSGAFDQFEGK